jgi:hypothetical protein
MLLFSRIPLLFQTEYAELKRRAAEQAMVLVGSPGSVGEREVNGRRFHYRQFYDAQGTKSAQYLGPVGESDAEAKASAIRAAIETSAALVRDARILAGQGYVRADRRAIAILASLTAYGLFRGGAVLVGSHAYGVLLNDLGVRAHGLLTEDVDIACGARIELEGAEPKSFEQMLAGSTVPLLPVPGLGRNSPTTSYKARGADRLRVDLLTPTGGSEVTIRAVPELDAHAMALPALGYLLSSSTASVVLGRESVVPVRVPAPEVFTWHKMLVSQLRGETREKRSKDVAQAAALFAVLTEDAPGALDEAFAALPRGTKSKVRAGARLALVELQKGGHEAAVEELNGFL